ncbi:MBOAT family O-acyltransferase [Aquirufa nivalisilvae]
MLTIGIFMPLTLFFFLVGSGITYWMGNKIQSSFPWKGLGIGILIGFLIIYKLKESWIDHINLLEVNFWENTGIWQIVGLSFFVFNAVSYLMDIRRRFIKPADSFFKLMLYLLYFPTLHAGPLHRFSYLNEQFDQANISEKSFSNGMRLILWGLFKNFVLAQRLNQLLISLRESEIAGWWTLLIGFVFFFYLYFSFSSFIDFFQGLSEIFNIQLKDNFHKRVYFSINRHEFWKGWHITLNEWFRDYFFYWLIKWKFWRDKPYLLLLMTYVLIGLWHGFTWAYFFWGFLSGIWILVEKVLKIPKLSEKFSSLKWIGVIYHVFICSALALVFVFSSIEDLWDRILKPAYFPLGIWLLHKRNIFIILFMFLQVDFFHIWSKSLRMNIFFERLPAWQRRVIYIQLFLYILILGMFSDGIENFYLQF